MNNEEKKQDKSSTEESIESGKKAIEIQKETAPAEDDKKESAQKKDAENWRNEG